MALALDTLAYALKLREAGFTEQQAEGQARALADAMTDTLATKQDLNELAMQMALRFDRMDARFDRMDDRLDRMDDRLDRMDGRLNSIDNRFEEQDKRFEIRLGEMEKRLELRIEKHIADLDRRITVRMLVAIGTVSALVKLL